MSSINKISTLIRDMTSKELLEIDKLSKSLTSMLKIILLIKMLLWKTSISSITTTEYLTLSHLPNKRIFCLIKNIHSNSQGCLISKKSQYHLIQSLNWNSLCTSTRTSKSWKISQHIRTLQISLSLKSK